MVVWVWVMMGEWTSICQPTILVWTATLNRPMPVATRGILATPIKGTGHKGTFATPCETFLNPYWWWGQQNWIGCCNFDHSRDILETWSGGFEGEKFTVKWPFHRPVGRIFWNNSERLRATFVAHQPQPHGVNQNQTALVFQDLCFFFNCVFGFHWSSIIFLAQLWNFFLFVTSVRWCKEPHSHYLWLFELYGIILSPHHHHHHHHHYHHSTLPLFWWCRQLRSPGNLSNQRGPESLLNHEGFGLPAEVAEDGSTGWGRNKSLNLLLYGYGSIP